MAEGPGRRQLMPHTFGSGRKSPRRAPLFLRTALPIIIPTMLLSVALFSLPALISSDAHSEQLAENTSQPFPVSVNPAKKTMVENPVADELIEGHQNGSLSAAVWGARGALAWVANVVTSLPFYAYLGNPDVRFVVIQPGYRREEVAQQFARELGWNAGQRKLFLQNVERVAPTLSEGEFVPGTYEVHQAMTPADVQMLLAERFANQILSRYTEEIALQVPLKDALTIASLIERETGGADDMRVISAIIWNRLFINMNLQIDATLQYAKAEKTKSWWPPVVPKDKYIKSSYNTYSHKGLPPAPIANPSVAAVIAALNPKPTDCVFYFHDSRSRFHCSATYKEHVRLLKKYYGQGK